MFRMALALAVLLGLVVTPQASAAALVEVTNFGPNPSNLRMHVYRPDRVAARPGILLAPHYCTGSGPEMHRNTEFATLADQYGFVVIYPSVTRAEKCFDVSSPQALRRDAGSDPVGLISMVRWSLRQYRGNPARVYVTGISSGAMMTNVMVANYPDVFNSRRGVRRCAGRLLRDEQRLLVEHRVRQRPGAQDAAAVG